MNARANPPLAALLMLCFSALIGMTTLLAKALGTDALGPALHPMQVSHGRFLFAFIAIGSVVALRRPKFRAPHWKLHLGRTSLGWLGVTLMFAASARIPLSDATAITFLNPVFTMMLAIPLLGERVGAVRWSAAVIALLGAVILLRPGPGTFQVAALLALASALVVGLEVILIKQLSGREPPLQLLFVNNAIGVIIATVAVIAVWQSPTVLQWAGLIALGMFMALAQTCFLNAMARADASFAAPFTYASLIFAGLYDAILFSVVPDIVSVAGALIILCGAGVLAWREARRKEA